LGQPILDLPCAASPAWLLLSLMLLCAEFSGLIGMNGAGAVMIPVAVICISSNLS
jgi:hypothetical protein